MYEVNPFLRGANKATDAMTKKVMNAFARNYESAVNDMFKRLHEEEYKQLCKDETFTNVQASTLERMAQEEQSQKFFDMTAPQMRYAPDYTNAKDFSSIIEKSYSDNVKPNMYNPYEDEDADSENTNSEQIDTSTTNQNTNLKAKNEYLYHIAEETDFGKSETFDKTKDTLKTDATVINLTNQNTFGESTSTSSAQDTFDEYRKRVVEDTYNPDTVKYEHFDNTPVTGTRTFEYNPENYQRLAFNDRASVVMFLKEMNEQGITAVAPSKALNGQYLVEVPLVTSDGKDVKRVIDNYVDESHIFITQQKESVTENNMPSNGINRTGLNVFDTILLNPMGMGSYVNGIPNIFSPNRIINKGEQALQWGGEVNQKEYFNTSLNAWHEAAPKIFTGFANRATVLYGDTVIMNGKIVTDEAVKRDILEQHKQRVELGEKILDKRFKSEQNHNYASIANELNKEVEQYNRFVQMEQEKLNAIRDKKDGETILEQLENNARKSSEHLTDLRNSLGLQTKESGLYSKKDIKEAVETAVKKIEGNGFNLHDVTGRFDIKALKNISSQQLAALGLTQSSVDLIAKAYKPSSKKLTLKQQNAEAFKSMLYRQEYTQRPVKRKKGDVVDKEGTELYKTTGVLCSWSYGALEDITNAIKQEQITRKTIIERKMTSLGISEVNRKFIEESLTKLDLNISSLATSRGFNDALKKIKVSDKFSEEDRKSLLALLDKDKFILDALEKAAISATSPFIDDLTTSSMFKHLKLGNKELKMEDLIKINEVFLNKAAEKGFYFVKATGSFDIKKLENLTSTDLARLGINARTRDKLVQINQKGAFGAQSIFKSTKNIANNGLSFFITRVDKSDDWQEILQAKNNLNMIRRYSQQAITSVRRLGNIRVKDLANAKKIGRKGLKELYDKPLKPIINKKPKPLEAENFKARNSKYIKKQEKVLAQTTKAKNSVRGKLQKSVNSAKNKVASSKIGQFASKISKAISKLLWTAVLLVAIAAAIFAAALMVIFIVGTLIECLLEFSPKDAINDLLAPSTYADTVAYQLYEGLGSNDNSFENDWLQSIQAYDKAFENKEDVKYGMSYQSYNKYISSFNNIIVTEDGEMYVNPFHFDNAVTADKNKNSLTKVNGYTGVNSTTILTNASQYSAKSGLNPKSAYDNGHTSNVKDIIAMTDVMFQFEQNAQSDDNLQSIMGCSPAQLNWDKFCKDVGNFFRCIGNFFAGLFGATEPPFELEIGVSYATIQNYASTLFQCSHQQTVSLTVNYYDVNKKLLTEDGQNVTGDILYRYGICNAPEVKDFKIGYDKANNKTSPYITANGKRYWLDRNEFETKVLLGNATNLNGLCLRTSYGDNKDTYDKISGNACWTKSKEETKKTYGTSKKTGNEVTWTVYADKESDISYITDCLKEYAKNYATELNQFSFTDSYKFTDDARSVFQAEVHTSKEEYETSKNSKNVEDHFKTVDGTYVKKEDDKHDGKKYAMLFDVETSKEKGDKAIKYKEVTEEELADKNIEKIWKVSVKIIVGETKTTTLTRNCQKHSFKYCGGHISCESNGIVYSMTNEQLNSSSIYENSLAPVTEGFRNNLEIYGWKKLQGKYDLKSVDKTSALTMSMTGQIASPESTAQGSAITNHKGMNLYVENGEWKEGIYAENVKTNAFKFQDIFDVDCCILYGKNVFPFDKPQKYEGWSEDNMSMAINRVAMDWYEVYGFDIPLEIGSKKLGESDIKTIIEAVKEKYNISEDREEALKTALGFVGRGHYNSYHDEHSFLTNMCTANGSFTSTTPNGVTIQVSRSGNCTAATDKGYAIFVLKRNGIDVNNDSINRITGSVVTNFANCDPADLIIHERYSNSHNSSTVSYIPSVIDETNNVDYGIAYSKYVLPQYAIFVGVLDKDIQLMTGQTLKAGVPILVDIAKTSYGGAVQLHCESSTSAYSTNAQETYWWAEHLDGRVKYRSFNTK